MGEFNVSSGPKTPKPGRFRAFILPAIGLVAVLVGVVIAQSNESASFSSFAYAPLSNQVFMGYGVALVSQGTQLGLAVAVVGLLILAFWAGHRIGRQPKPEKQIPQE